jgi:hypothetical protein
MTPAGQMVCIVALENKRREIVAGMAKANKVEAGKATGRGHIKVPAKLPKPLSTRAQLAKDAAEIRLRAERRLGEMLAGTEKQSGARGKRGGGTRGSKKEPQVNAPPTLAEVGVSKKESSRAGIRTDIEALDSAPDGAGDVGQ